MLDSETRPWCMCNSPKLWFDGFRFFGLALRDLLWRGSMLRSSPGKGFDAEFCYIVRIHGICGGIIEDKTPRDPSLQEYGNKLEDRPCDGGEQVFRSDTSERLKFDIMVEGCKFVCVGSTEDVRDIRDGCCRRRREFRFGDKGEPLVVSFCSYLKSSEFDHFCPLLIP
jgi:hypothetical protein